MRPAGGPLIHSQVSLEEKGTRRYPTSRKKGEMTSGTESEVMWPQAKEHQQLLEEGRGEAGTASRSIRGECSPAHTLTSVQQDPFWTRPLELSITCTV